ncbi:MAG: tetratricopeptide repeat protein [Gammaproteobacteria bacterium]|nr:tetratricopeptide repeat protein [Gammaproteobacteria bacterium]
MSAEELVSQGRLDEALNELQQQVRKDPANPSLRVFLFQILATMGQWDRALRQLNVAGEMDTGTQAMMQTYREALRCEVLRGEIFAGKRSPMVFGDPEQWIALLVEALALTGQGEFARSQKLRGRALESAPTTGGRIDDADFAWIADADTRMGPILEAIINGRYYWVPFHRVQSIRIEKPQDLRDAVWTPAYFTWANGGEAVGLIPTRYPGSEENGDGQIRLAHRTEWREHEADVYLGQGQRVLSTDVDEYPLMNIREIVLDVEGGTAETAESV